MSAMSTATVNVTAELARQVAELSYADLPDEVVTIAEQGVLDTVAVAIAARSEPVVRILVAAAADEFAPGESSLLDGSGRRVNPRSAALVNGTAAHALDFDDMHPAMIGHPSAPLVPAVLALAEECGSTGAEVITALVSGYEVQCRIGAAGMPSHYMRGFHPTGTAATFGVAAAAGRLLGLDADRLELALGIAGTQAAGMKSMFGTMCKPLHSGKAAANGIFAAKLASHGFTSCRDVLGAPQGFFAAETDDADLDIVRTPFGDRWYTRGIVFKLHAACGYTHAAIESMLAVREQVSPDDVTAVDLLVNPELVSAANIEVPTTPLEAKFSVRWVTAMALARGSVAAPDFTTDLTRDAQLRELSRRVSVVPDSDGRIPRLACVASVHTRGGDRLVFERDGAAPLWRQHPVEQRERLCAKFASLVDPILGARAARFPGIITRLRSATDVRSLVRMLAA
jgi:2-methylcitrate dehydratase PrpD